MEFIVRFLISFFILYTFSFASSDEVTIKRHILFSNDDAEEHMNGVVDLISTDLEMCWEEDVQAVALRFKNIDIPKGAFIKNAYIQFETDEVSDIETILNIYIQDTLNPPFFINTPFNITSRKKSSLKVVWRPSAWRREGERGIRQRTPNLSSLINYFINKKGYKRGGSIVFIIRGAGKRVAKAFLDNKKSSIESAPTLYITYSLKKPSKRDNKSLWKASSLLGKIVINEILTSNGNVNYDPDFKNFSDWIELYNNTNKTINLKGFYLSNDWENLKKWRFPSVKLKSHSYLIIWADGKDVKLKALHTNFKLSKKSSFVILSDKDANVIDSIAYPKQSYDISYGRGENGYFFMYPSPKKKNLVGFKDKKRSKKVVFSIESGFYDKPIKVILKAKSKDTKIYYTLDGSTPNLNSNIYKKPIKIKRSSVLKAIAIEKNRFPSKVVMHTYLIDEKASLPVISIGVDKKYLYDKNIGIVSNYEKDWLRAASIEYIKNNEIKFRANVGIKISGNNTRWYPQKSFAIFFKKRFGDKILKYPLFRDKPYIKKIKSFTLRNSGTYWGHSLISEGIIHQIAMKNMDIDAQSYQPCVVFINGKYEGIYNIRERMNKDYIRSNYKIKNNIDLIEHDEYYDSVKSGNIDGWYELTDFIRTKNIKKSNIYKKVALKLDIDEFINHLIIESFFANSSIAHNVKRWRIRGGKWRSMLFDLDRGFQDPNDNVLGYILDNNKVNIPFVYLIQNRDFKIRFLSRYFSHLNITFKPSFIDKFISKAAKEIEPEIRRHFNRWPYDKDHNRVSLKTWQKDIQKLYYFSHHREKIVRDKLKEVFDLKGEPILRVFSSPKISLTVDGIKIKKAYKGIYFNGAKVILKAKAKKGCEFKGWSNGKTNDTIILNLTKDINITAFAKCR